MARETAGSKLRRFRRSRGVTQEELARELGFAHQSAIAKREADLVVDFDADALDEAILATATIAQRKRDAVSAAEVLAGE
ncbi:MAG TPA: helix-turn-helix transcriptional regulator [Armatimonadota bacterium]|nr:helix-turn-helix transcriptional regulator [Armatimonadota bacterium]